MVNFFSKIFNSDEFDSKELFSFFSQISLILLNVNLTFGIFLFPSFPNSPNLQFAFFIPMLITLFFVGPLVDKISNKCFYIGLSTMVQGVLLIIMGITFLFIVSVTIFMIFFSILSGFNLILTCSYFSEQSNYPKKHMDLSAFLLIGFILLAITLNILMFFLNFIMIHSIILGLIAIGVGFAIFYNLHTDNLYLSSEVALEYSINIREIVSTSIDYLKDRRFLINLFIIFVINFIIGLFWGTNVENLANSSLVFSTSIFILFFIGHYFKNIEFENSFYFIVIFLFIGVIMNAFNLIIGLIVYGSIWGLIIYYTLLLVPSLGLKTEQGRYYSLFFLFNFSGFFLGEIFGSINVIVTIVLSLIFAGVLIFLVYYFKDQIEKPAIY
ncbi:MAG: hypothetical protein EAX96_19280 [Candidatus Lokiarchaeota archaeon]|nr:hypothetical protein [Candidatus Lokiarchaeota archaeon]